MPLFRLFNSIYFSRRTLRGRARVPKKGPVILVLNHPAVADAFLVGPYLSRRRLAYFMAEEELFFDRFPFRTDCLPDSAFGCLSGGPTAAGGSAGH